MLPNSGQLLLLTGVGPRLAEQGPVQGWRARGAFLCGGIRGLVEKGLALLLLHLSLLRVESCVPQGARATPGRTMAHPSTRNSGCGTRQALGTQFLAFGWNPGCWAQHRSVMDGGEGGCLPLCLRHFLVCEPPGNIKCLKSETPSLLRKPGHVFHNFANLDE